MAKIQVRYARLDDTSAISHIFRARVSAWQRINAQGKVEDVPYETLTLYERWLHGGAWMSVETGAIFLSHLLHGRGLPIVAVIDGVIQGYAEVYPGDEPAPFGKHLHLAHLTVHPDANGQRIDDALVRYVLEEAQQMHVSRVTVGVSGYDDTTIVYYSRFHMTPLVTLGKYTIIAQTGQGFYRASECDDTDPAQIAGWLMSIGRTQSARYHWETLWTPVMSAIPEIEAHRTDRLTFSAAGRDVFLICRQDMYNPRNAEVFCWSPKPLTAQFLIAVRDWAHRQGYRTLTLTLPDNVIQALKLEAETIPFKQIIYAVDV